MYLQQFFVEGLGHGSYLLGDEPAGLGAVIDPRRDLDAYLAAAQAAGLRIAHVLETHTHNDYVSGAKELAHLTGARLWASGARGGAGLEYPFEPLTDGGRVSLGAITLRAWETPGHTPEHLAYLAYEGEAGDRAVPAAVFTGGSLMVGGAGRTDLSGNDQTEMLTRAQYGSVRRLLTLPGGTLVYPTHGGGSFCGGAGGGSRWSTIGAERHSNPLARLADAHDPAEFSRELLTDLPVIPAYWTRMRPLNRRGPVPLGQLGAAGFGGLLPPAPLAPAQVRQQLEGGEISLIDARDPAAFGGAHIAGSFSIGLGDSFGIWAGSVVPDDRPIVLVLPIEGGSRGALALAWSSAVRQLLRAGFDRVAGYLGGGLRAWADSGHPFDRLEQLSADEALSHTQNGAWTLLDVRQPKEWEEGHAPGATHVPGASLPDRIESLDKERRWLVTCSTGYRSSIAASLLRRAGFPHVGNLLGGMSAWSNAGLPVER